MAGHGLRSVFLQDADALAAGAEKLLEVLGHLRRTFPQVERVTCYSRSAMVVRYALEDLSALRGAGLNRLRMGWSRAATGCCRWSARGPTRRCISVPDKWSAVRAWNCPLRHAGSADRTFRGSMHSRPPPPSTASIPTSSACVPWPCRRERRWAGAAGQGFVPCSSLEIVQELLLMIESLRGISSIVVSDHVLNLFEDLEGRLPGDKGRMVALLRAFLALDEGQRTLYLLGRRAGCFRGLADLQDPAQAAEAKQLCAQLGVTAGNVEEVCAELMKRYI
ncbi:MAG: hypothetical protein R2864_05580 [Syntrophotaleaceae bacterium]